MLKKIPKVFFYIIFIMLFIILFFVMMNVTATVRGIIFRSLKPIFYGAVLAYLFKPMCNFFDKRFTKLFKKKLSDTTSKKLSHYLSMLATYVIFGAIIYFLLSIILPQLVKSIVQLVSSIPAFYNTVLQFVHEIVASNPILDENIENILNVIYHGFNSWYQESLFPLLSGITGGVVVTFKFLLNIFIGIIVSVYLLNGRKKLGAQAKLVIKSIFPKNYANAIFGEIQFADRMFSGYFAGTLIDSALVGVICYLLCLITGMPFAILVSVIVGVANIIPFFGPYIGMIPSAVIILTVSPIKALAFLVMVWILQQIDGNIIAPKIIGSNTGLSSFWVLFAILLFGGLFGFFGMIIGSPVFAVIYHVVGKVILKYAKIRGEHDFVKSYEDEYLSGTGRSPLRYRFGNKKDGEDAHGSVKKNDSAETDSTESDFTKNDFKEGGGDAFASENGGEGAKKGGSEKASDEAVSNEEQVQISFFG